MHHEPSPSEPPSIRPMWTEMQIGDFQAGSAPVQETLFAEPDRYGTPDMFGEE